MHTSEFPPVAADLAPLETAQPEPPPAPVFGAKRALWIVLSYILTQLGVVMVAGIAFGVAQKKLGIGPLMAACAVGALAGTAVAWRMARASFTAHAPQAFQDEIGVRSSTSQAIAIATGVGLLLSVFNSLVLIGLFPPSSTQDLGPLVAAMKEGGWARHLCVFFGVCVAPPTEEFLFRGVLFSGLARRMPRVLAGLISTTAFVLMHVSSSSPYWAALASVALLAIAAQVARVRTGSLVPGIAMHTAYNAAVFAIAYLQ